MIDWDKPVGEIFNTQALLLFILGLAIVSIINFL